MLGKKGKTNYNFPLKTDRKTAEATIEAWLTANSFKKIDGENTYQGGDKLVQGLRFFEYQITDQEIQISVFLGSLKKPIALTDGFVGAAPIMYYKDLLAPLFASLDSGTTPIESQTPTPNQEQSTMPNQTNYNNFQAATDKRKTTCAEISFWVSILLLISSFAGISMSVILVIVNYYLAAQGLKTRKRGKSIAAMVMTSISIVILLFMIIVNM